ncbi:MAG: RNA polymerase sigma factor [Pseudomonadota bacterium]
MPVEKTQPLLEAFLEHRDTLSAYLAQRLLSDDEIDDVLQEAYLNAMEASKKRSIRSPKSYLFIIARNLVSKRQRRAAGAIVREMNDASMSAVPTSEPTQDLKLHYQRKFEAFRQAVDTLPTQCRRVFLMRKLYGYSHKTIAKKLGISTSTVERHITNAIMRLSMTMRESGYAVGGEKVSKLPTSIEAKHE